MSATEPSPWVADAFTANAASTELDAGGLTLQSIAALPSLGTASGLLSLILASTPGTMQTAKNYYRGAVLTETGAPPTAPVVRVRILSSKFLGVAGTPATLEDRMQVTVSSSFNVALGAIVHIRSPTDLGAVGLSANPFIFVPSGRQPENSYPGTVLYNQTIDDYRRVSGYDGITKLLSLDTSGTGTHKGPIDVGPGPTQWADSDTYVIRSQPPLDCLQLDMATVDPGTLLNNSSFNLPNTTTLTNLAGGFLEVKYQREPAVGTAPLAGAAPTRTVMTLSTGSTQNNYYAGCTLRMSTGVAAGQIAEIESNVGSTVTLVAPGFTVAPAVGDDYQVICPQVARRIIRYANFSGTSLPGAPDLFTVLLPAGAADQSGAYNGMYIRIGAELRLVSSYIVIRDAVGAIVSRTITVFNAFPGATSSVPFSITSGVTEPFPFTLGDGILASNSQEICILPFSYDNLNPFVYSGSLVSQQEMVCYEIQLLNLVLPNEILSVAGGGQISFYPYVYVRLQNVDSAGSNLKNIIYSNNPNATNMLFRAAIKDVPNPLISPYIKIDGNGTTQTVKFKPNDNLHFSVLLPNGETFDTILEETFSPNMPNPLAQISAMFSIRRLG
jgi:hypothetical protein